MQAYADTMALTAMVGIRMFSECHSILAAPVVPATFRPLTEACSTGTGLYMGIGLNSL